MVYLHYFFLHINPDIDLGGLFYNMESDSLMSLVYNCKPNKLRIYLSNGSTASPYMLCTGEDSNAPRSLIPALCTASSIQRKSSFTEEYAWHP